MKRRGFFGLLAGAAVAGPGMVKEAAAASLSDLSLPTSILNSLGDLPPQAGFGMASTEGPSMWAAGRLAKIIGRTAAQHAYHLKRTGVHALDPDIASYRSIALHRKIRWQQERNYARDIEGERGYLEATIAGWFE
jgi:hypothetical protein